MSKKWNSDVAWQRGNYILRVTEESFAPSRSSSSPMITLKHEVVAPEEMDVAGVKFNVAGVKVGTTSWFVTYPLDDEGNLSKDCDLDAKLTDLKELYKAYGVDPGRELTKEDLQNPPLGFKGKLVWYLMDNDLKEIRKTPTAEQLAKGIRQGDPILHPITKLPMKDNWPRLNKPVCPAEAPANSPY